MENEIKKKKAGRPKKKKTTVKKINSENVQSETVSENNTQDDVKGQEPTAIEMKFLIDNAVKIDSLGKGLYNVITEDGSEYCFKLSAPQWGKIDFKLRNASRGDIAPQEQTDENNTSEDQQEIDDDIKPVTSDMIRNRLGFRNVEGTRPNYCFYWANGPDLQEKLGTCYRLAQPKDIKDYEIKFGRMAVGIGRSAGPGITVMGDTLLVTTKENRKEFEKAKQMGVSRSVDGQGRGLFPVFNG